MNPAAFKQLTAASLLFIIIRDNNWRSWRWTPHVLGFPSWWVCVRTLRMSAFQKCDSCDFPDCLGLHTDVCACVGACLCVCMPASAYRPKLWFYVIVWSCLMQFSPCFHSDRSSTLPQLTQLWRISDCEWKVFQMNPTNDWARALLMMKIMCFSRCIGAPSCVTILQVICFF